LGKKRPWVIGTTRDHSAHSKNIQTEQKHGGDVTKSKERQPLEEKKEKKDFLRIVQRLWPVTQKNLVKTG